jgi:hypothetical protein
MKSSVVAPSRLPVRIGEDRPSGRRQRDECVWVAKCGRWAGAVGYCLLRVSRRRLGPAALSEWPKWPAGTRRPTWLVISTAPDRPSNGAHVLAEVWAFRWVAGRNGSLQVTARGRPAPAATHSVHEGWYGQLTRTGNCFRKPTALVSCGGPSGV